MEQEKNKNGGLIALLSVIIVILLTLVVLLATGTINFKREPSKNNQQSNENTQQNSDESSTSKYTENDFKKVIDDELYILFGFKSLNEVTNGRKLTLVFNKLDPNYSAGSFSKQQVEEAFNATSIRSLGIQHETFDIYTYENDTYTGDSGKMSKRNLFIPSMLASKIINYRKNDDKYVLEVKYIFTNNGDSGDRGQYGYGSWNHLSDESKHIVEIYTYESDFNIKTLIPDLQKYLDENYDSIKDKLDTYVYTFEVVNDKINLVDFSIR